MGRFVDIKEIGSGINPALFVTNRNPGPYPKTYILDEEILKVHPHRASIHTSRFESSTIDLKLVPVNFWLIVRRWVEREAMGDCIYHFEDKSYKWCWNEKSAQSSYEQKYSTVDHGYWHFNFDMAEDHTFFTIKFSEFLDEVLEELPNMPKAKGRYIW